jgi:WD40 repeat protein
VTGNYDGSALLWDMRKKLPSGIPGQKVLEPSPKAVSSVAFSPDGGLLATASWNNTVAVWQTNNLKAAPRLLTGHTGPVLSVAFLDGKELVTGSADKTVRLWDVTTGNGYVVTRLAKGEAVLSLAYSPKRRILAIGTTENTVLRWDLKHGKQLPALEGHTDAVTSMVFSPDGTTLATGSVDTTAKLWDAVTGTLLATLQGHSKRVLCLSFSPDGTRLTTGSEDGSVRLWDTSFEPGEETTRHALITLKEVQLGPAFAVAFSPDGQILATGNADGTVLLRYAANEELIARQSQPGR